MTNFRISDHALVRFLERAGGLDVEELRARLANSLARAHHAANSVDANDYLIKADGLVYVVRRAPEGHAVTTIYEDEALHPGAKALAPQ